MSTRFVLGAVLLGVLAMPAHGLAQGTENLPYGMRKIGDQLKQTVGTVTELRSGDRACYLTLRDSRGKEFTELGSFEVCQMHVIGKRVTLTYNIEEVMAESCQGNPRCMKKDKVPLVIDARVMKY